MTEDQVNIVCRKWLEGQGFKYKGVLNSAPNGKHRNVNSCGNGEAYGQVPVPDGSDTGRAVLLDHQGVKDRPIDLIWIEAKGSNTKFSILLEGFIRMAYAVYYGGGTGLLAIPDKEYKEAMLRREFLAKVSRAAERTLGILNAETLETSWFI